MAIRLNNQAKVAELVQSLPRALSVVAFCSCVSAAAFGQQTPDIAPGLQPSQSYDGGQIDSVDLWDGNLTAKIPLISYPQRGNALKLDFALIWNGKPWIPSHTCYSGPGVPQKCIGFWTQNGGVLTQSALTNPTGMSVVDTQSVGLQLSPYNVYAAGNPNDEVASYDIAEWHTSDGAIHPGGEVTGTQTGQISIDGSGFYTGYPQLLIRP